MKDDSDVGQEAHDQPRKRAAIGDGISPGKASPYCESLQSPPRRSKARTTSAVFGSSPDAKNPLQEEFDSQRPSIMMSQLWTPDDNPLLTSFYADPSNIASIQAQNPRAQQLLHEYRETLAQQNPNPSIANRSTPAQNLPPAQARDDNHDIILQPETRPISQEQLIAEEVKGICAGSIMVEAKRIEFENKHPLDEDYRKERINNWLLKTIRNEASCQFLNQLLNHTNTDNASTKIHQNQSSLPNRKLQENRRKILRVRIRDREHEACPDSGFEKNIMEESFAMRQGYSIRRRLKDLKQFELGNGKIVWSVGRVCVPVELPGSTFGQKKRWFHVLPNCPVSLILGMKFLREAEILTKNRNMLESCPPDFGSISSLLWIGSPRQRMKCSLDGQDLLAVADTGSDLNLMSLKCAKRGKFHIDRRRECRQRVRVGDGSEAETIGQVCVSNLGLDWRSPETKSPEFPGLSNLPFGPSDPNISTSTESISANTKSEFGAVFHVLPGLPCDVIFGRDLLETTNAFSLCPELSEAQHFDNDNPFELSVLISLGSISLAIPIPRRKRRVTAIESAREQHDNERHAEMYRRSEKDDEIALVPVHEQERAKTLERRRTVAWDNLHVNCVHCCQA